MDIKSFLKSLVPSFEKDDVMEDIRVTRVELKDITHPAYVNGLQVLKTWKFKSPQIVDRAEIFDRQVKFGSGNMIAVIEKGIPVALENLENVEDMIQRIYNENVASAGMTYMKAQLLQFVECVSFVSKYARKLLNYVYIYELAEYDTADTKVEDSLTPAEKEWIERNFVTFCTAFNVVVGHPNEIKKNLGDIPDIVVTPDNVDTLPETVGMNKVDPLSMRFIPVWLNPVYHIGMRVAEWQAKRYKSAKEELTLLQLRKLNLQRVSEGKPDAKVQKEIKYLEDRINGLNFDIAEMEKKYA